MWIRETHFVRQLLIRIGTAWVLFSGCRAVYWGSNASLFPRVSLTEGVQIFLAGLRFDLSAVVYINTLLIISYLLPIPMRFNMRYRNAQFVLFLVVNSLFIAIEVIDAIAFPIAQRRAILTDFSVYINAVGLLPQFLMSYVHWLVVFVVGVWGMAKWYRKSTLPVPNPPLHAGVQWMLFLVGVALYIVAGRGGLQLRPITPIVSVQYVSDMRLAPIVSNTTLNLLGAVEYAFLKQPNYLPCHELTQRLPYIHPPDTSQPFRPFNVVIIALESFGREVAGGGNPYSSHTPFLDSLLANSYTCQSTYANGTRSAQGVVGILTGFPSMMDSPLMFSPYQNNQLESIASLLGTQGYTTAFLHGSNKGSMEFERFAKQVGFRYLYNRTNYPHPDRDYDGSWGIWDAPYLQYTATIFDTLPQPFAAFFFSLTSHHPYRTESGFDERFPNLSPYHRSVRYTDTALRQFFQTAATKTWFDNTLFVITADHSGTNEHPEYQTRVGRYAIPLFFYHPQKHLHGVAPYPCQQADVLPSVLHYMHFPQPYPAMGTSVFDTTAPHYIYEFAEQTYYLMDNNYQLFFDGNKSTALYQYTRDTFLKNNLLGQIPEVQNTLEKQLQAAIQTHHTALIRNQMKQGDICKDTPK